MSYNRNILKENTAAGVKQMEVYKVQGDLSWVLPMLVYVQNGFVVGEQQNPSNGLTYRELLPEECYPFSEGDWQSCEKQC